MATERLPMRDVREMLRLKLELGMTHRAVAKAVGISNGPVGMLMARWKRLGLTWAEVEGLAEDALEQRIFGPRLARAATRPMLGLHRELMKPAVTLEVLHIEYLERHADGYRYSRFCAHYKRWLSRQRFSMKQEHRAGEKLCIDYSGRKPAVMDATTGEVKEVELFAAVLGASSYVYAEATWTQQLADFVASLTLAREKMLDRSSDPQTATN